MDKLKFNCETFTSMKKRGSCNDCRYMRSTIFKGMMRYWWRLINPNLSLHDLVKKENEIFGDNTSRRSPYSMYLERPYNTISEDDVISKFNTTIKFQNNDPQYIELIKNIYLFSIIMGGIGVRSHRGYGSIKISAINDVPCDGKIVTNELILSLINSINPNYVSYIESLKKEKKSDKSLHPFMIDFKIGKTTKTCAEYLQLIENVITKHGDNKLFKIKNDKVIAPLNISLIAIDSIQKVKPVITTLNNHYFDINDEQREVISKILA